MVVCYYVHSTVIRVVSVLSSVHREVQHFQHFNNAYIYIYSPAVLNPLHCHGHGILCDFGRISICICLFQSVSCFICCSILILCLPAQPGLFFNWSGLKFFVLVPGQNICLVHVVLGLSCIVVTLM